MLILEQDGGDEAARAADVERMAEVCRAHGAAQVAGRGRRRPSATSSGRRGGRSRRRWAACGPNKLGEDIVVPKSEMPAMVRRCGEIAARYELPIPVFGHAGDGNLHPNILFDRRDPGRGGARRAAPRATSSAPRIALGGTLSGEHGIGTLKREFLEEAQGDDSGRAGARDQAGVRPAWASQPAARCSPPARRGWLLANLPVLAGATPG